MAATGFYARPSSSFGYWRGVGSDGPLAYGQGSNYGQKFQGKGILPPGSGDVSANSQWSPTITYLLVFIVAEIVAFGLLAKVLR